MGQNFSAFSPEPVASAKTRISAFTLKLSQFLRLFCSLFLVERNACKAAGVEPGAEQLRINVGPLEDRRDLAKVDGHALESILHRLAAFGASDDGHQSLEKITEGVEPIHSFLGCRRG